MTTDPPDHGAAWDEQADDVMARLEQDARYERLPRMAKTDYLAPETCDVIAANAREFLKHENVTQKQLARMAGISPTVLNELLAGKYRGDPSPACKKLNAVMEQHLRRVGSPDLENFTTTGVAKQIFTICKVAAEGEAGIGVITAVSGVGKTLALKACVKGEFPNGIYLEINPGCCSPLWFCRAILHCLRTGDWRIKHERGIEDEGVYTRAAAFNQIVQRLAGSHRLIVVDEAENLNLDTLNLLRQILDATGCNAVLAGRPPLLRLINQSVKVASIGGSVRGRVIIERQLTGLYQAPGGGQWLFSIDDVIDVLEKHKVRISSDAGRWLAALANISAAEDSGALRYAVRVFRIAMRANKSAQEITLAMVQEANALQRDRSAADRYASLIEPIMAASRRREARSAAG